MDFEINLSYKLIKKPFSFLLEEPGDKKIFLGNKTNRVCLFCGKSEGVVSFKKIAHVIPAALANRTLFNYNECDICNDHFSNHENELANYLMLDRVIIGARKRKGSPKYKPIVGGSTYIERKAGTNIVEMTIDPLEEKFEVIKNEADKTFTYKINDPPPYRPADICKCLTHMAWGLLPNNYRENLSYVSDWLVGKVERFPLYLDVAYVPRNGFSRVILELWESIETSGDYPILIRFTFGFKIFTFYIPKNLSINETPKTHIWYWQTPENIDIVADRFNIYNNDRINRDDIIYTFHFKDISEEVIIEEN